MNLGLVFTPYVAELSCSELPMLLRNSELAWCKSAKEDSCSSWFIQAIGSLRLNYAKGTGDTA